MENGDIPDENIEASVSDNNKSPWNARLNGESYWRVAKHKASSPWIQADIGYQTDVSGVVTQGGGPSYIIFLEVSTFSTNTDEIEVHIRNGDGDIMVIITFTFLF